MFPKVNEEFIIDETNETDVSVFVEQYGFEKCFSAALNTKENFPNSSRRMIDGESFDRVLVDFIPCNDELYEGEGEYIYLICFNNKVIKIGGTRTGMKKRMGSYKCGTRRYRKKGTCATTNYHLMEAMYAALMEGKQVDFYVYKVPTIQTTQEVFGETKTIETSMFTHFESRLIEVFTDVNGTRPVMSPNG